MTVMRCDISLFVVFLLMAGFSGGVYAQKQERLRKYAFDFRTGGSVVSTPVVAGGSASSFVRDLVTGGRFDMPLLAFDWEYYIPKSPFSIKVALDIENVGESFDEEHKMPYDEISFGGLMLGGRYYMARPMSVLQPYAGLDVFVNPGAERWHFENSVKRGIETYHTTGYTRNPVVSIGPMAGVDVYITRSFAIQFELGYRFGINGYMMAQTANELSQDVYHTRGNLNRLVYGVGWKFTFPFHDVHKCDTPFRGLVNRVFTKKKK